MKRLTLLFIVLGNLISFGLTAQNARLTADAPRAVIAGEKFQLVYSLNTEGNDLRLPAMNDIQVLMGPSTSHKTSMTVINGNVQRSSEYSFTYILKIDAIGKHTIPPASIMVDGKKIESNSIQLEVVKGESGAAAGKSQASTDNTDASQISGDDLILTISANKKDVYKDEPIVLTTKIYVRNVALQGVSGVKNPELRDFISQELPRKENIDWTIETINGKTYNVGIYDQKLLFPQKSGNLTISPVEIEFLVKQRVARRSQSIFDDFFENNYRNIKKTVTSKPVTINVKSLPAPPSDFSGVVGDIKMDLSVSKNNVKTNDGITLKLDISGTGNHRLMSTPVITIPSDFDQYDPKITNNITNSINGMSGVKTFEYLIIPRHAGSFTIPPISLSYFDTRSHQYKQLTTAATLISVEKGSGEESTATTQQYTASREDLKFIGKDIRYIKIENGQIKPRNSFLLGSLMFYIFLLLPIIVFAALMMMAQKQIHENANIQLSRHRKASKIATKRLKNASNLLKTGNKEAFYDELLRAVWGYLGDKLSLPVAQLSRENSCTLMQKLQVTDETIQQFMNIIDTCEFARYSPASGSAEMDKLYHETIDTITLLEAQIKRK